MWFLQIYDEYFKKEADVCIIMLRLFSDPVTPNLLFTNSLSDMPAVVVQQAYQVKR